jgi:hypothetical protein
MRISVYKGGEIRQQNIEVFGELGRIDNRDLEWCKEGVERRLVSEGLEKLLEKRR